MAIDTRTLSAALRMMPDQQLQQVAQLHHDDPYIFPLAFQESQERKMLRNDAMAGDDSGGKPVPINQQALMAMGAQPMPEDVGLGAIPMKSDPFAKMAEGGIVAFAGGGKSSVGSYEEQIRAEAVRQGVDPDLMVRMFATESAGKPNAVSPKGAAGLGQLMIPAAKEMGLSPEDRFKPSKNIPASVGYFKKQLSAFDNDPEKAAAAYNWGPGAMRKHLASSPKDWKLGLPKETANYLTKLMPVGTAQAQTAPPTTAPTAAPEAAKPSAGGLSALLASLGGAAAGAREALTPSFKPGTTLGQAFGRTAATAGPLAALGAVGGGLTAGATNALSNATDEQLEQLQTDIGGDTGVGSAIILAQRQGQAAREGTGPALPPVSSYGDQMKNVLGFLGKAATLHPDVTGQGRGAEMEPAPPMAKENFRKLEREPSAPADINPKEAIAAAKSTMTPEERKESGFSAEDWLTLGFALLSGKSPYALQNLGEAGAAMLAGKTARTKAGLESLKTQQEIAASKAMERYHGSLADTYDTANKPLAQMRAELAAIDKQIAADPMLKNDPVAAEVERKKRYASVESRYKDITGTMSAGAATGVVVPQGVSVTRTG
jgi:hypothetical protein